MLAQTSLAKELFSISHSIPYRLGSGTCRVIAGKLPSVSRCSAIICAAIRLRCERKSAQRQPSIADDDASLERGVNKGFGLACTYLPSGLSRLLFFVLMALASDPSSRKNTRAVAGQTYIRPRGKVQKMALERNS